MAKVIGNETQINYSVPHFNYTVDTRYREHKKNKGCLHYRIIHVNEGYILYIVLNILSIIIKINTFSVNT